MKSMHNSILMLVLSTVLYSSASSLLAADKRFRENSSHENNLNSVNVESHEKRRDVCNWDKKIFQLKMFWEKGMEWQNSRKEKAWCAECYDDCDKEENVRIRECDDNDEKQQWIFYRCTVRPKRNQRLCITAGETRRKSDKGKIELHTCNPEKKIQFFNRGKEDLCLTQEHHPRDKERLRFTDCKRAKDNDPGVYDDTSHWVVGKFDGHP